MPYFVVSTSMGVACIADVSDSMYEAFLYPALAHAVKTACSVWCGVSFSAEMAMVFGPLA